MTDYSLPSPLRLRLQQAANRKRITVALEKAGLEFVGFTEQDGITHAAFREFVCAFDKYAEDEVSSLSELWGEAPPAEVEAWLLARLTEFGIEDGFFLVIFGVGVEVKGDAQGQWLSRFWSSEVDPDLVIISSDCQRVLAFLTNEHEYLAITDTVANVMRKQASREDQSKISF